MKITTRAVLLLLLVSCLASSAVAQEEADRLGMIRAVNRNSFQAIHSLHAKYTTITIRQPQKPGDAATRVQIWNEWWQDGKQVRWITEREVPDDEKPRRKSDKNKRVRRIREEGVFAADGVVKSVRKQSFGDGKWVNDGAIAHHKSDQPLGSDLWIIAMFVIRQQPRATLADLLDDPKHVKHVGVEIIENRQCEKLLLQPPATPGRTRYDYEVVVDPRYNYLVRRLKAYPNNPEARKAIMPRAKCNMAM